MQYEPLCRTTHHLESRNRPSNDLKTNRLIPRLGNVFVIMCLQTQATTLHLEQEYHTC